MDHRVLLTLACAAHFSKRGGEAMSDLSIGLSALKASQLALDTIGENISNANTPGYHQQVVNLTNAQPTEQLGLMVGSGVDVASISQLHSDFLDGEINSQSSQSSATDAQLQALQQVQSYLSSGTGSVQSLMDAFFNQLGQLTSTPDDLSERQVALGSAQALTGAFNSVAGSLDQLSAGLKTQATQTVDQINALTPQIAALNSRIAQATAAGANPNDLIDQRDQLVSQLAALAGIQTVKQGSGQINVMVGGALVVGDSQATRLTVSANQANQLSLQVAGSKQGLTVSGGTLGGILQSFNQDVPHYLGRINQLAASLISRFNEVHATGLGLSGPMAQLTSTQAVMKASAPLASSGLAFSPQAGTLFVSVTDLATGNRTQTEVSIDPSKQSLQDVATALSAVPHLQALVNSQTGTMSILAQRGFAFDFAGQLPTSPDSSAVSGTTTATLGGAYTGSKNDELTFQVQGTGTVGVTSNLTLKVTDGVGNQIASLNIGQGYEPGSALQLGDGVTVRLASGTANNGDEFKTQVVSQPDTANILSALGLNAFFTGSTASSIGVQPALLNDPSQLAVSATGQPGDSTNLQKLVNLSNQPMLANGTQTLDQFGGALIGDIGLQVQTLTQQQGDQQTLAQSLQTQQQSISGVDPNQELVQLVQYQQSYQLASHYINVVNQNIAILVKDLGT
jgi:flagellar hook-associated protein 1